MEESSLQGGKPRATASAVAVEGHQLLSVEGGGGGWTRGKGGGGSVG